MNIQELSENLGLTKDEYLELVDLLIDTGRVDLDNAEAAIKERNHEEAHHRLHSFKGAAGNLGLMEIYERAKEGEQMAKNGMLDQLPEIVQDLKNKLNSLVEQPGA